MTSIRKALCIGVSTFALTFAAASAQATQQHNYGGGSGTDIDVTKIDDSFNTMTKFDTDVDVDVDVKKDSHNIDDSFNKNTNINVKKTDIDVKKIDDSYNTKIETEDSFNHKDDHSIETTDSHDIENSFNKFSTSFDNRKVIDNDELSLDKNDNVTASVLEGTVANNSVSMRLGDKGRIEGNVMGDHVQQYADGVNMNVQNTGANSSAQQSVAIKADIYNTDSLDMGGSMGGSNHGGGSWGGGYGR